MDAQVPTSETSPVLLDLLSQWEDLRHAGQISSPEDICEQHPNLIEEFKKKISVLSRLTPLLITEDAFPNLPGYELLNIIGFGGMGKVFRARDITLDRIVAIKIPHDSRRLNTYRAKFEQEGKTLAKLRHRNILPIHTATFSADIPYIVMDYAERGCLAKNTSRYFNKPLLVSALIEQVCYAVHHAHMNQIVHRDLKPSNILIDEDGKPQIGDFGIASLLDVPFDDLSITNAYNLTANEEKNNSCTIGTPAYLAPELCRGARATPTSDIWSIGVIVHELLTAKLPAGATERIATKPGQTHLLESEHAKRQIQIPRGLKRVVTKCLSIDPASRFQTALDVAKNLSSWRRKRQVLQVIKRSFVVALIVSLIFCFVAYCLKPDSAAVVHAKKAAKVVELTKLDREMNLIGENGFPETFIVRSGQSYTTTSLNEDGFFAVSTLRPALIEFLPFLPFSNFRFEAEIKETGFMQAADVGLYCFHQSSFQNNIDHNLFCLLTFADLGPNTRILQQTNGEKWSAARLRYSYFSPPGPPEGIINHHELSVQPYNVTQPTSSSNTHWRKVVISSSNMGISGDIDQYHIPVCPFRELQVFHRSVLPSINRGFNPTPPAYQPKGGIGFFVNSCSATIKNCKVTFAP